MAVPIDFSQIVNNILLIFIIAISALSGVFVRTFWLLRKKKIKRIDTIGNLISAFSSIFFTSLVKYFFFNKDVWPYEVYAGISFLIGISSTVLLDLLTDPKFIATLLSRKVESMEEDKKIEIEVKTEKGKEEENKEK